MVHEKVPITRTSYQPTTLSIPISFSVAGGRCIIRVQVVGAYKSLVCVGFQLDVSDNSQLIEAVPHEPIAVRPAGGTPKEDAAHQPVPVKAADVINQLTVQGAEL